MIQTLPLLRSAVLCATLCLLLTGCTERETSSTPPPDPVHNVILISIDTLRADHVGAYGYERPTTPAVDAFAAESVLFSQAIAQAPSTLHSHASIFSSLVPQQHRASWGAKTVLDESVVTVTEVLAKYGYRSAAFAGGGQMAAEFGLAQGFDHYFKPEDAPYFSDTVRHGVRWMEENGDQPFFLFLHNYEVHHPYEPRIEHQELLGIEYDGELSDVIDKELLDEINKGGREIEEEDLAHIVSMYDAEIRSMDQGFEALVAYLRERGIYDNTLIVFTSDHGEEFGEHGVIGWHSHTLYDELLRVPLIIKYPAGDYGGTVVDQQVRSIDIAPTVLGYLQLPAPADFCGSDLAALVEGGSMEELPAVSRMDRAAHIDRSSIRTEEWKLAGLARRRSLYDLSSDPEELWDRSLKDGERAEQLEAQLQSIVASCPSFDPPAAMPTDKTFEELKALGYIN